MTSLFAFLHHIAAFTLFAALVVELILIREVLTVGTARRLQVADMVFGISAGILIVVGLLRVFYFEKGAYYYFHTWTFIAKLALFVIIGLVSIVPTLEFLSWRKAVKQGQAPSVSPDKVRALRSIMHWELAGVVVIILMAALMAKGVGLLL
jgi:putative membrane protein